MQIEITIALCLATLIRTAVATDYCSTTLCKPNVTHIACDNTGQFASTCPADAAKVNINAALQTLIVAGHNALRNLVAGGTVVNLSAACRMATMQWDDELASMAAFNVLQCAMEHDKCHNTDSFKYSGQNLAWMSITGAPNYANLYQEALNMWYNEEQYCNMTFINSYPNNYQGPAFGHFTVMVADRNIRVGCATYKSKGIFNTTFLVACNYATTNMVNYPVYASCGKAGSTCTTGMNSQYPNLCSTREVYNVNTW